MNIDGNFSRVGSANVEVTKAYVEKLSAESWSQDGTEVQQVNDGAGTQLIYLVHDDRLRHDQPSPRPALEVFGRCIRPILAVTADHFDSSPEGVQLTQKFGSGYFIRASLLRISGGAVFTAGEDVVFSETHAHRVHVPIVTHRDVVFTVDDEALTIPEGEIFEINNRRRNIIQNNGERGCVHLVLDYVLKGEMCCCGRKGHPQEPCSPEACFASDRAKSRCECFR
jgi:hypothetical protein